MSWLVVYRMVYTDKGDSCVVSSVHYLGKGAVYPGLVNGTLSQYYPEEWIEGEGFRNYSNLYFRLSEKGSLKFVHDEGDFPSVVSDLDSFMEEVY